MENIILVDTLNLCFNRFFGMRRWYSHKDEYKEIKKDEANYNWLENKVFMDAYNKNFLTPIERTIGKKNLKNSVIIFVIDPPQDSIWRHEFAYDYKGNRKDLSVENNFKPIFKYTFNTVIPGLCENKNITKIKHSELEADDMIALTVKYIRDNYKGKKIFVCSSDQDFLQLGDKDLSFVTYKPKRKPKDNETLQDRVKRPFFKLSRKEANEMLVLKIVNGDGSDNIPSIFKGVKFPRKDSNGNKITKKELLEDINKLIKFIEGDEEFNKKFKRNQKIIDFTFIPKKYLSKANTMIKKTLSSLDL